MLAADVESAQLVEAGDGWGGVTVTGLRWSQVSALFADEPAAERQWRGPGGAGGRSWP